MSIQVRFFASLRERLGQADRVVDSAGIRTVADVWSLAVGSDVSLPPNVLAAVNMEYAEFEREVTDGDEVAFFPPVTGG